MSQPNNNSQSLVQKNKKSLINFRATRDNFMASGDQQQIGQSALNSGPMSHGSTTAFNS